jgi:hypothetical protein
LQWSNHKQADYAEIISPEQGCVGLTKRRRQEKMEKVYFPQKNVGMICKKCKTFRGNSPQITLIFSDSAQIKSAQIHIILDQPLFFSSWQRDCV